MRNTVRLINIVLGGIVFLFVGNPGTAVSAASGGSNLYANSTINYGPADAHCTRSMTKHFFCDTCGTFWPSSCPGCTAASLPPDTSAGYQTGTPTSSTVSVCLKFSTSAAANAAMIAAGGWGLTITGQGSGWISVCWSQTQKGCNY
jgi:hypothetical protein